MKKVILMCSLFLLLLLSGCACKHTFGEWMEETPATCLKEGTQVRICSECNEEEHGATPLADHAYGDWQVTKKATCTESGTRVKTCSNCGVKIDEPISISDHTFGSWQVTKQATCTETGTKAKVCSGCGEKIEETLSVSDHTYGSWQVTKQATCTHPGTRVKTCSGCGAKVEETVTAQHSWKEATCTAAETCKSCGATRGSALGHNYADATCSKPKTCRRCGATSGSKLDHKLSNGTCSLCNKKLIEIVLKVPRNGTYNNYATLEVYNYTDEPIVLPSALGINGYLCWAYREYTLQPGYKVSISYYRAILESQKFDSKNYDMYLDSNSQGYIVIKMNGEQYYAEYGVKGITYFRKGGVNG